MDSIYLETPTTNEILNQITSLKNKAVGRDNIQPFFLKSARLVVTPCLKLFLNYVFTQGLFPNNCKMARVTPIPESGAKDNLNNYHPISNLTCFSKIIETILHARLSSFSKKHRVFYENQYGFQSNISTMHALLDVATSSYDNIDNYCYTGLAFVDLRKAFDTASHETLSEKLSNIKELSNKFAHNTIYTGNPNSFRNHFFKSAEHSNRVTRQSTDNTHLNISRYRTIKLWSALNIME